MARLIYSAITSLDGYTADADGDFGWAAPDEAVHAFVNDLERPVGTYLYGRRMYEVMAVWETMGLDEGAAPVIADFARIWRGADKVVFSRTLEGATTPRTRLEREFDPDAVRALSGRRGRRRVDRRSRAGGPGDPGGPRRRVPAARDAARGRRRDGGAPRRRPHRTRAGGHPALRQRRRVPPVPARPG